MECLQRLLSAGANVAAIDNSGRSALELAAAAGTTSCLAPLIAAGAPFGAALHDAAGAGHVTFVLALLEAGADADADLGTVSWSPTARHRVASGGHVDCIRALLAAGAHTEAISWVDMWTPMHSAVVAG